MQGLPRSRYSDGNFSKHFRDCFVILSLLAGTTCAASPRSWRSRRRGTAGNVLSIITEIHYTNRLNRIYMFILTLLESSLTTGRSSAASSSASSRPPSSTRPRRRPPPQPEESTAPPPPTDCGRPRWRRGSSTAASRGAKIQNRFLPIQGCMIILAVGYETPVFNSPFGLVG